MLYKENLLPHLLPAHLDYFQRVSKYPGETCYLLRQRICHGEGWPVDGCRLLPLKQRNRPGEQFLRYIIKTCYTTLRSISVFDLL